MSQIFVAKNYGQRGPFSEEEVYELLENNEFSWDDLAWREGMQGWDPLRTVLGKKEEKIAKKPPLPEVYFHHVAAWKFILLSIATLGLYELYWFYRGWSFVKRSEKSRIMPFWRTVFAPIWFYPFAARLFRKEGKPRPVQAAILAAAFFLIAASWQLPDPAWILSSLTFLPMLPLVWSIDRMNRERGLSGPAFSRFRGVHAVSTLFGIPIFLLAIFGTLFPMDSNRVIEGTELPESHRRFLLGEGILPEGESVVAFYSAEPFGYEYGGSFFTEKRVVSYWLEQGGSIWIEEELWNGIEAILPDFSSSIFKDATVEVLRFDGSRFIFSLSNEEEEDRWFVETALDHWKNSKVPAEGWQ